MKKIIQSMLLGFMICLSVGKIFAAEENYITESAFASSLNTIAKTESTKLQGTDEYLTREKAAQMIVAYLNYSGLARKVEGNSKFNDVITSKGEIELVKELGIINGVSETKFAPKELVSVKTAQDIVNKVNAKLNNASMWKHACYAINSSSQMNLINQYQAVSFGWAEVAQTNGNFNVTSAGRDFKVPSGFEMPVDLAQGNGVETYLMIYFDGLGGKAEALLGDEAQCNALVDQIVTYANGITKENQTRSFDGVSIDFEGFKSSQLKLTYNQFLYKLKAKLQSQNMKMNVMIQPSLYYKGYDYKTIGEVADHVILMAHDYGTKNLSASEMQAGNTTTPLTPIDQVYEALREAKNEIADPNKIVLQFSFASLQWQKQNSAILNQKAYTPTYEQISTRLQNPGTEVFFDKNMQSTYATYEENGVTNFIWYEDAKSIQAKIELAKLLGINSFSYWRLGTIPSYIQF